MWNPFKTKISNAGKISPIKICPKCTTTSIRANGENYNYIKCTDYSDDTIINALFSLLAHQKYDRHFDYDDKLILSKIYEADVINFINEYLRKNIPEELKDFFTNSSDIDGKMLETNYNSFRYDNIKYIIEFSDKLPNNTFLLKKQ